MGESSDHINSHIIICTYVETIVSGLFGYRRNKRDQEWVRWTLSLEHSKSLNIH